MANSDNELVNVVVFELIGIVVAFLRVSFQAADETVYWLTFLLLDVSHLMPVGSIIGFRLEVLAELIPYFGWVFLILI